MEKFNPKLHLPILVFGLAAPFDPGPRGLFRCAPDARFL